VASTTQLGDTLHVLLARDAPPAARAAEEIGRHLRERGHDPVRAEESEPNLEDAFVALLLGERLDASAASTDDGGTAGREDS
jgi:hypothetical protein